MEDDASQSTTSAIEHPRQQLRSASAAAESREHFDSLAGSAASVLADVATCATPATTSAEWRQNAPGSRNRHWTAQTADSERSRLQDRVAEQDESLRHARDYVRRMEAELAGQQKEASGLLREVGVLREQNRRLIEEQQAVSTPGVAAQYAHLADHPHAEQTVIVIDELYWALPPSSLQGILDQVRTRLTQFVAELRSTMPNGSHAPTPEQVHHAVQSIHITAGDGSNVTVTAPVAYAESGGTASVTSGVEPGWWRWRRGRGGGAG
ncbi:hypothetical protein ACFVRB_21420 [Streptomyces nojiriensis]|uniref:hypothetical protein n=1 Tax=Streptomyces nojiriensis TaxID=66374 RepID=UPI0036D9EF01